MINPATRNLIDLSQKLWSWDLNKSLSFDFDKLSFKVDHQTVAGSKKLDERTFLSAEQHLTEAGEKNVFVRRQVAAALRNLAGGAELTAEQREFMDKALRELLGKDGDNVEVSLQVASKPLELRVVKRLLAKAERLFALSNQEGKTAQAAAKAADFVQCLKVWGPLNGEAKKADKLIDGFERDLASLGAKLAQARTEEERTGVQQRIKNRIDAFNVAAVAALSEMKSESAVAREALAKYVEKGGEQLGQIARERFLAFAHKQLEPGMQVKAFRAKLLAALPGFVADVKPKGEAADTKLKVPVANNKRQVPVAVNKRKDPAAAPRFIDAHVKPTAFVDAERTMRTQLAAEQAKVAEGKNVLAQKRIELGADVFNVDAFLPDGPDLAASFHDVVYDYRTGVANRRDVKEVSLTIGERTVKVDFPAGADDQRVRDSKAGIVSNMVLADFCGRYRLQAAMVLVTLGQRTDQIANVFARELGIENPPEGSVYAVSRDVDGSVLVKISTAPDCAMSSSITIRVGKDGERTVVDFSGVKTNEKFVEEQELAARRAKLTAQLPECQAEVETGKQAVRNRVAELVAGNVLNQEQADAIVQSADTSMEGLLKTFGELAQNGRPDKADFGDYSREFMASVDDVVARCGARIGANVELAKGMAQVAAQLGTVLKGAAERCRGHNEALAAQLDAFATKVDDHLKQLRSDFYLSGEDQQKSVDGIMKTLKDFAALIEEKASTLPAKPAKPEDVAKYAELLSVELPRSAVSFSQAAREALQARYKLVSGAEVAKLAVANPAFAPVADSVNLFAVSVNDLLEQAGEWSGGWLEDYRTRFSEVAHGNMEKIVKSVTEALSAGVDFDSNGIEALLRESFDAIASTFRECEAAQLTDDLVRAVREQRERISEERSRNWANLTKEQIMAMELAEESLGRYRENVEANGTSLTRQSVKTAELQLRQEVDRFLRTVLDTGVGAKAWRLFGRFSKQDPASLYPFNPPEVNFVRDRLPVANPFGSSGVGSVDALDRLTNATLAVKAAIKDDTTLMERALSNFELLEGAARFRIMDEDGNVRGIKEEGRQFVEATFRAVVQAHIADLAAPREGAIVDVNALATPEWKNRLLEDVQRELVAALKSDAAVAQQEAADRNVEAYARGGNAFGLDVDRLTPVQVRNLKKLVFATLMEGSYQTPYRQLRQRIDAMEPGEVKDEWSRRADAIMDQWIRDPKPRQVRITITEDDFTAVWSDSVESATNVAGNADRAIRNAILSGRFSLDEELSDAEMQVIVESIKAAGTGLAGGVGEGTQVTGLGTVDPAEVFSAMRLNGLSSEVVNRLCAPLPDGGGFEPNRVNAMLELLYLINQRSVHGLDSLAVRIFGKHIAEMTYAEYLAYIHANNLDRDFMVLDPLFRLRGADRQAADFFLRTGLPSTDYVIETRNLYDLLGRWEREGGVQEANVTYAGRRVTLKTDGADHLEMVMGQVAYGNATKDVRLLCPLDLRSFRRQIEDEMSLHVKAYGASTVLGMLSEAGQNPGRVRQLALNVIAGTTGTLATELCNLRTRDVLSIARDLLTRMAAGSVDAKAFLASAINDLGKNEVVCFNGEATLESYRRMEQKDKDELDAKVVLPEAPRRLEGETVAQARLRQVHAFVSELVMPNDTTKYDLDRRDGRRETDILLNTLKKHRYELDVVLRTLGSQNDVLDSFSMVAGDAEEGKPLPRMSEMTMVLKARMGQFKSMVSRFGGTEGFFKALEEGRTVDGLNAFLGGFVADIEKASHTMLEKMQRMLTDKLSAAFRKSMAAKDKPVWKQTLDEIAGAGTLDVDSGYGQFLMESLATYFTAMEPIDRHRMASALFRYADSSSNSGQLLGALIKGAGPVLQKLMQGLPQTALPADLRDAVADLKSRLPSIAPEMVRATLLDMVEQSQGRITKIELVRSFGAATVGQTFLCRVYTRDNPAGEECVLKLLRPDVQNRARRERALFLKLAGKNATMKNALATRIASIFDELDFTVEANNVKQGAVYNFGVVRDGITGVRSMELYPYISTSANVMVLRKAPGTTYDRYVESTTKRIDELLGKLHPTRNEDGTISYHTDGVVTYVDSKVELRNTYTSLLGRQRRLSGFIQKWTFEAIFGDGFFHGDLHSGNLMCDDDLLTVIDYGNAQRLSKDEMKNLKWALAWIPAHDVGRFLNYYREVLSSEGRKQLDEHRADIEQALKNIFERADPSDSGRVMSAVFQVIQQNKVELPGSVFCILQSMQRLDESMRLLNEQLARVKDAFFSLKFNTEVVDEPEVEAQAEAQVEAQAEVQVQPAAEGQAEVADANAVQANPPDGLKPSDKYPFILKLKELMANVPFSLTQMAPLREHFGPGLTLAQMRERVNDQTSQNIKDRLAMVEHFGEDVPLEQILRRFAEVPREIQLLVTSKGSFFEELARFAIKGHDEDGELTVVGEAKALVARMAGGDVDDARQARTELLASAQQILDFFKDSGTMANAVMEMTLEGALMAANQFIAKLADEEAPVDPAVLNAGVDSLYEKLRQVCVLRIPQAIMGNLEAEVVGPLEDEEDNPRRRGKPFPDYDAPSMPFGIAINRGSKAFMDELIPKDQGTTKLVGGVVSTFLGGGLILAKGLRNADAAGFCQDHREHYFSHEAPWSTFQADKGIYPLEAQAIQDELRNFRFSSEVLKDLQRGNGWVGNARKRTDVCEVLRFNLDNIVDALRAKGFGADVDNPAKRQSLIEFAMIKLAIARPEWYQSLRGADWQQLSGSLGDNADLRTAFECLHRIATANPPVTDQLTDEDKDELVRTYKIPMSW